MRNNQESEASVEIRCKLCGALHTSEYTTFLGNTNATCQSSNSCFIWIFRKMVQDFSLYCFQKTKYVQCTWYFEFDQASL